MSHYLEQLAGRERRALCCANDAAMAVQPPQMRCFLVRIGTKQEARLEFAAMGPDSMTVFEQHVDLCEPLERCDVMPVGVRS